MAAHLRPNRRSLLVHQDGRKGRMRRDRRVRTREIKVQPRQVPRVHVPERHGGLAHRPAAVHPHRARGHRGSQVQGRRRLHGGIRKLPGPSARHAGGHRVRRRRRDDADDPPRRVDPRPVQRAHLSRPRHGDTGPTGDQDHRERGPRRHPPGRRGRLLAALRHLRARRVRRRRLRAVQEYPGHARDAPAGT